MLLVATDLTLANSQLIWTVPQAHFEAPSQAAQLIDSAERSDPSAGPFRIHRMLGWFPAHFINTGTAERFREWIEWERGTLHPLYALPMGLEYCDTVWALELDDHAAFFRPRAMPVPAGMARVLGIPAGQPVAYFPRRSYDLWGARYFVLPATPDWSSLERGFASFLDNTELIHPGADVLYEKQDREGQRAVGLEPGLAASPQQGRLSPRLDRPLRAVYRSRVRSS